MPQGPIHDYTVRRSDRARRARLTVTETGEAVVVLPRRAPLREAAMLVEQHADWLERHITRVRLDRSRLADRPALGEGRSLLIAGEPTRIRAVDAGPARRVRGRVEVVLGGLIVRLGRDGRDSAALLDAWLRQQARSLIGQRVAARAIEMSVRPGRITIRDQSSRWASASRDGSLSFSWRLILAPPFVLDAVVVHELAHLRVRGHDSAFWSLAREHAPRTAEARRWLREHAREVRAALD
ncbi:MAG: M48 family metallopeptidase [Chloroflexota bacterium]